MEGKVEPLSFVTLPSLSWTADLKTTGTELELLTNISMILFYEKVLGIKQSIISQMQIINICMTMIKCISIFILYQCLQLN